MVPQRADMYLRRGLICKSFFLVSALSVLPLHQGLTFRIFAGFRCNETSLSGLTTGILSTEVNAVFKSQWKAMDGWLYF